MVFKHPEKGKVGLREDREALVAFLEYLEMDWIAVQVRIEILLKLLLFIIYIIL